MKIAGPSQAGHGNPGVSNKPQIAYEDELPDSLTVPDERIQTYREYYDRGACDGESTTDHDIAFLGDAKDLEGIEEDGMLALSLN